MNTIQIHKAQMNKPIVLIGMMGSGKTYIGARLARALDLPFVDSDRVIEEKAGCLVSEIFARDGEAKFREVEHKTITDLLESVPQVIATGGGAVLNADTMAQIKDKAISVWLRCDIDTLYDRVSKNQNRPLLQVENPRAELEKLVNAREKIYASADFVVENPLSGDDKETSPTLNKILKALSSV